MNVKLTSIFVVSLALSAGTMTPAVSNPFLGWSRSLTTNALAQVKLSETEKEGILFMREEEKLARDVYAVLAKKWGAQPFGNIQQSEQNHMDAVLTLIQTYRLKDPVDGLKPGQFKNVELRRLYAQLLLSGGKSRLEGLKAGATIEDLDLADLYKRMTQTERPDILNVYDNLARGSRNHLRSFVRGIRNAGSDYTPQFITRQEFDRILSTPNENAGPGNSAGGRRGRRG